MKLPSKSGNRLAVIDIGSNTFHLLIVQKQKDKPFFSEIYRERRFVYISSEGIKRIPDGKIDLAIDTLQHFKSLIDTYTCENIVAVGTSAIRSSENGKLLLDSIERYTGIHVRIISGQEEARLIYEGTQCLDWKTAGNSLIMDIGGGSVEFVLQSPGGKEMLDFISVDTGISVLRKLFGFSEPVTNSERKELYKWLDGLLKPVFNKWSEYAPVSLLGSSGPFEIIESMMGDAPSTRANVYTKDAYTEIARQILSRDIKGRGDLPGMPAERADLSKESFLIIDYIMGICPSLAEIVVSPYAIKEGLIMEFFNKD